MNFVQPIRDPQKIEAMKAYLKQKRERDYMLFLVGISIGLRISDILLLQKEHVLKLHIDIKEKKMRKHKRVKVPPFIKRELVAYANALHDGDYFFLTVREESLDSVPNIARGGRCMRCEGDWHAYAA